MPWKPNSPERVAQLEAALLPFPCEKRSMFGCPVYFVNGQLCAGVHDDRIFLRLAPDDRARLLSGCDGACPFEPLPGRVMREYAVLPVGTAGNRESLVYWLALSHAFVAGLPPKEPKQKRKVQR